MDKVPKRANKAISLLEDLVEQLHYFYGDDDTKFKKHVLNNALEIENILKDLAINKKDTFKRIAKSYNEYYRKKQEVIDNTVANATDIDLNTSIKNRYNKENNK